MVWHELLYVISYCNYLMSYCITWTVQSTPPPPQKKKKRPSSHGMAGCCRRWLVQGSSLCPGHPAATTPRWRCWGSRWWATPERWGSRCLHRTCCTRRRGTPGWRLAAWDSAARHGPQICEGLTTQWRRNDLQTQAEGASACSASDQGWSLRVNLILSDWNPLWTRSHVT